MLSLYNITNGFMELFQNEEITEEEYNKIGNELAIALKEKSTNIIGFYKNMDITIEAMKNEEKRIAEMRKSLEKKKDKFKEYIKINMEQLEISKIETELGNIKIAKSPLSVDVSDIDKIPSNFKVIEEVVKVDKTALKEHFKATGELVEGVVFNVDNTNLQIK